MTDIVTIGFRANTKGLKDAERGLNRLSLAGGRADNQLMTMRNTLGLLGGALAALGITSLTSDLVKNADAWKSVNNQLRQVTKNEAELVGIRQRLLSISRQTNSEIDSTVDLYSNLYRSTRDLGLAQSEVAEITKTINNLFLAGGKSAAETAGAVRQLAQGLAAGALRGDEFNSVAEGAPRIMDALAVKLNKTRGELRDFAATGGITAEILTSALADYSDEAQRMADITERTFGMSMVNARTNIMEFAGSLDTLKSFTVGFGQAIESVTEFMASGELEARLSAWFGQFNAFGQDITNLTDQLVHIFQSGIDRMGESVREVVSFSGFILEHLPSIFRAAIQRSAVEIAALVDYASAYGAAFAQVLGAKLANFVQEAKLYGRAIGNALNPFSDDSFDLDSELAAQEAMLADLTDSYIKAAEEKVKAASDARDGAVKAVMDELDASIMAYETQMDQAAGVQEAWRNVGSTIEDTIAETTKGGSFFDRVFGDPKKMAESFNTIEGAIGGAVNELQKIQGAMEDGSKGAKKLETVMTALSVAQGAAAIANAMASGDPYTAVARAFAVAATLAAAGINTGVSGGASTAAADAQASQGTGGVLGDSAAKSESIMNAVEITADATRQLPGLAQAQLEALRSMQQGIGSAANLLLRGTPELQGANTGPMGLLDTMDVRLQQAFNPFAFIFDAIGVSPLTEAISDFLGGSSSVINSGITILGGSISDMLNTVMVEAFQDVESKKHFLDDKDTRRFTEMLGGEVGAQFSLVIGSMVDAVSAAADVLGITQDQLDRRISNFRIRATEISLMDLTGEEQQAELEAVFSQIFDDLANAVIPYASEFQQVGEGIGETLVRVATQIQVADELMGQLGNTLLDGLSGQAMAQASDDLVKAFGGLENFMNGIGSFVDQFATDEHKLTIATDAINSAFAQMGQEVPATADGVWALMQTLTDPADIARLAGLTDAMKEYYGALEEIETERRGLSIQLLRAQGDAEGALAMERQIALEGLNESNRAIQEQIWALNDQAAAAERATAAERELAASRMTATDTALGNLRTALDSSLVTAEANYNQAAAAIDSEFDRRINSVQSSLASRLSWFERSMERVSESIAGLSALSSQVASALEANINTSVAATMAGRASAQTVLLDALQTARAGGRVGDISGSLAALSQNVSGQFGSLFEEQRDMAITANRLQELGELTDAQLSTEERTLALLEQQRDNSQAYAQRQIATIEKQREQSHEDLTALYDAQVMGLEQIFTNAEEQINSLRGIETFSGSIDDALTGLETALVDEFANESVELQKQNNELIQQLIAENKELRDQNGAYLRAIRDYTQTTAQDAERRRYQEDEDAA